MIDAPPGPEAANGAATTNGATTAFAGVEEGPRGHFRLHFYAAVYQVLAYLNYLSERRDEALDVWLQRYPFLGGYLAELLQVMPRELTWAEGAPWWQEQLGAWEGAAGRHLPLAALARAAALPWESRLSLLLVGLVEEDSRFGTLFAELQSPTAHRRPHLELVGRLISEGNARLDPWTVCRPLLAAELVESLNPTSPRAEWVLHVPDVLWDALRGEPAPLSDRRCATFEPEAFRLPHDLIFPTAFLDRLAQIPRLVDEGKADAVLVRGSRGSERLAVAGAVARVLGRRVVAMDSEAFAGYARLLGPLCTMTGALPVVTFDLAPGETVEVPPLGAYDGPIACLLEADGGLRGPAIERAVTLKVPPLGHAERRRHWEVAFGDHPVEQLDAINERFHLPGGYIGQTAAKAIAQAALDGRDTVRMRDVREGCRLLNRQLLDTLAEHLDVDRLAAPGAGEDWAYLVVNDSTLAKLGELQQRCRHRERLLGYLGPAFGTGSNRGVRALFNGPSGTGKTLAAKLLAANLGLDLYRVDLASVINKYIGETEKNLHRVLSTAEELDVILLLDEGDALLGSRTEVKSSNDRYANLETNYLLQRLEHYQGIVVVTTNLGENIDKAFQRRMDIVVEFLPPMAMERWDIWRQHLPAHHAIDAAFLQDVAVRCNMTGGQIRNAAHLTTLLALDEGCSVAESRHLEAAVRSEYRKAGATCPLRGGAGAPAYPGHLQAFLDALAP